MKMYKVIFEENKAILAQEVDLSHKERVEIEHPDGKRVLKSITVFAADELESISTANNMARYIIDDSKQY